MEVRGFELVDEIFLLDDDKCALGLLKVLSKANNGEDIRLYFPGVVGNFIDTQRSNTIRIMCYSLLQSYNNNNEENWDDIIKTTFDDAWGNDKELQIEALRLIPHLPGNPFLERYEKGELDVEKWSVEEDEIVLRHYIACLHSLLMNLSSSCHGKEKFLCFAWTFIAAHVFHTDEMVVFECFDAIGSLCKEEQRSKERNEDENASISFGFQCVVKQLLPSLENLLVAFKSHSLSTKASMVGPLALLSSYQQTENPDLLTPLETSLDCQQGVVVHSVVSQFLPLLYCDHFELSYECGMAIISLAKRTNHAWIYPVVTAFTVLIKDGVLTSFMQNQVTMIIIEVLPLLSAQQIFTTSSLLLSHTCHIHCTSERLSIYMKLFMLLLHLSIRDKGNEIELFLTSYWIPSVFHAPFSLLAEELFATCISCCSTFYSEKNGSSESGREGKVPNEPIDAIRTSVLQFLEPALPCLLWNEVDASMAILYLSLVDKIERAHPGSCQPIIDVLQRKENLDSLPCNEISAFIFLVIAKHVKECNTAFPLLLSTLQKKHFFMLENSPLGPRHVQLEVAHTEGYVGMVFKEFPMPHGFAMELFCHVLLVIHSRADVASRENVVGFLSFILSQEENPSVISRCKLLVKRMEANAAMGDRNIFSPHFFPSSYLPLDGTLRYRMLHCSSPLSSPFTSSPMPSPWRSISGSSSPLDIQLRHTLHPSSSSVRVFLTVRNHTDIPLHNIQILLRTSTSLSCLSEPSRPISRFIREIGYRASLSWDVTFAIRSFQLHTIQVVSVFVHVKEEEGGEGVGEGGSGGMAQFSNGTEFSNEPYSISPCYMLIPKVLCLHDFLFNWGTFPSIFRVSAKAKACTQLSSLLARFAALQGFYMLPAVPYDEERFVQIRCAAVSWFQEYLFFTILGELDPHEHCWILRFEFRSSSASVIEQFRSYVPEWIRIISHKQMFVLDDDATEDIFNITR